MKYYSIILLLLVLSPLMGQGHCGSCSASGKATTIKTPAAKEIKDVKVLGAPKKAHWISNEHYVVYNWSKNPKIGTYILTLKVYNKAKKQINNIAVTADAYMPSMKGSHDTGDKPMKLNKKGAYAIPVNFMMLGDWEILLKLSQGGKPLSTAAIKLNI